MKDSELQVLLTYRRQRPKQWDSLPVETKLAALEYESRERERLELEHEEERPEAA